MSPPKKGRLGWQFRPGIYCQSRPISTFPTGGVSTKTPKQSPKPSVSQGASHLHRPWHGGASELPLQCLPEFPPELFGLFLLFFPLNNIPRLPSQLNTGRAEPCFPFLSCQAVCQNLLEVNQKSFSVASPNSSHMRLFALPPGGDHLTALLLSLPECPKQKSIGLMMMMMMMTTKSIIDLWPKAEMTNIKFNLKNWIKKNSNNNNKR